METNVKINRGLKGVYFERSGISDIDGSKGELTYRGYQIDELAKHSSFEEVCYLIIFGELPSKIKFDKDGIIDFYCILTLEVLPKTSQNGAKTHKKSV